MVPPPRDAQSYRRNSRAQHEASNEAARQASRRRAAAATDNFDRGPRGGLPDPPPRVRSGSSGPSVGAAGEQREPVIDTGGPESTPNAVASEQRRRLRRKTPSAEVPQAPSAPARRRLVTKTTPALADGEVRARPSAPAPPIQPPLVGADGTQLVGSSSADGTQRTGAQRSENLNNFLDAVRAPVHEQQGEQEEGAVVVPPRVEDQRARDPALEQPDWSLNQGEDYRGGC